jgi:hypothetical protein
MKCGHGKAPGAGSPDITVTGSTERAVERHEATCKGAHVFWHHGWLFKVICCAMCGRRVA